VTLRDGDTYVKHDDGTLDVIRDGAIAAEPVPGLAQAGRYGFPAYVTPKLSAGVIRPV
jgi:hypothetical protein